MQEIKDAALRGHYDAICSYIKNEGDVNATCPHSGWTLLGAACNGGHPRVVEKLLDCPTLHLNASSNSGTPMALALNGNHAHCVELLLRSNLKVNVREIAEIC